MMQLDDYIQRGKDLVATAYNNKFKLLFFNSLIFSFAVVVILFWPRGYRSEAKIWLKIGRENSRIDPTATTGDTISIQNADREDEIKSVLDVLRGRGLAASVVDDLSPEVVLGDTPLNPGAASEEASNAIVDLLKGTLGTALGVLKNIDPVSNREEAILEIYENLKVGAERKSNVISIAFDAKTPELAQAIVQTVVDRYRSEHTRIHRTEGSLGFFDQQAEELENRVLQCSEDLRAKKEELGLATLEGQRSILEAQLLSVRTEKLNVMQKLEESKARKQAVTAQMDLQPPVVETEKRLIPNTGRDQLQAQLYSLQVQRMELESKMSDSNPRLRAVKEQEAEAKRQLESLSTVDRAEVTESLNQIRQQLKIELVQTESSLAGFEALLNALNEQETELLADVKILNRAEIDLRALERELQLAEKSLTNYSESVEEARVDEALNQSNISNISIAQAPTFQEKPISPSKMIVALLGIAAMMFGSVSIVSGLYLLELSKRLRQSRANEVPAERTLGESSSPLPRVITVPHQRRYRSTQQQP